MILSFWFLMSIAIIIIILAFVFILLLSKKKIPKREPDYYLWFVLGIVWLGAGIPLGISNDNYGLFVIGLVFMILGITHKKDWKKNHIKFKNLTSVEKKFKIWVIILLLVLIFILAIFFFRYNM